jgi:hypothetical protein
VLRFAPSLIVAKIGVCSFPGHNTSSLIFPLLKQLTLRYVSISEDVFNRVLSGCRVLESLLLWDIFASDRLHISSLTLRSIGFRSRRTSTQELIIDDAPCLERFMSLYPSDRNFETIRVIHAPKLKILGLLSPFLSSLEIASLFFQVVATSLLNLAFSYMHFYYLYDHFFSVGNDPSQLDKINMHREGFGS